MHETPQANDQAPALSVVMPVYNALPFLDAAVESILGQSFTDFEFVILDDGSTDGSFERLQQWASKDPRIRLVRVDKNLGPVRSSQRVAQAATAPIVARMDADDISCPDRLRQQIEVLNANPQAGVVGSLGDLIDSKGRQVRGPEQWRMFRKLFIPFCHGAMMYRRAVFEQVGGYRQQCVLWEDQDLVARMSAISDVLVIPTALHRARQSNSSTRSITTYDQMERALDLAYRCLERLHHGRDYEDILADPVPRDGKFDPRSYISLGSVILWAGGRPRLFGRLLKRGRLSPNFASLSAIVWTAWASVSPPTLRQFILLLARIRNAVAKQRIRSTAPVPWRRQSGGTRRKRRPVEIAGTRA